LNGYLIAPQRDPAADELDVVVLLSATLRAGRVEGELLALLLRICDAHEVAAGTATG